MNIKQIVSEKAAKHPLYSQEHANSVQDHIVLCKLFNAFGAGTWYVTEYNPQTAIAFGYVMGLICDEWGYFSLDVLADIKSPQGIPLIEVDLSFEAQPFKTAKGR